MRRPTALLAELKRGPIAWQIQGRVWVVIPQAKRIGHGAFRPAYRYKDYVIKDRCGHSKRPPYAAFKRAGLRPPQQWFVKGWVVQPYYTPLRKRHLPTRALVCDYDLHTANVGRDNKGRLVAFDW